MMKTGTATPTPILTPLLRSVGVVLVEEDNADVLVVVDDEVFVTKGIVFVVCGPESVTFTVTLRIDNPKVGNIPVMVSVKVPGTQVGSPK